MKYPMRLGCEKWQKTHVFAPKSIIPPLLPPFTSKPNPHEEQYADWGFGNTFFHKGIGVCIDHLLYTPDMRATGYKVIDSPASDHLPICATLAW